jgi:hypothetical protein
VRPADIPHLVGDPTAVHAATGWKPHIPIERTLDEVLDEWRSSVGAARLRPFSRRSRPRDSRAELRRAASLAWIVLSLALAAAFLTINRRRRCPRLRGSTRSCRSTRA